MKTEQGLSPEFPEQNDLNERVEKMLNSRALKPRINALYGTLTHATPPTSTVAERSKFLERTRLTQLPYPFPLKELLYDYIFVPFDKFWRISQDQKSVLNPSLYDQLDELEEKRQHLRQLLENEFGVKVSVPYAVGDVLNIEDPDFIRKVDTFKFYFISDDTKDLTVSEVLTPGLEVHAPDGSKMLIPEKVNFYRSVKNESRFKEILEQKRNEIANPGQLSSSDLASLKDSVQQLQSWFNDLEEWKRQS